MAILYLTEQQAWVGREGDCLIVHTPLLVEEKTGAAKAKRERKKSVPLNKIEEVVVLGDITLSAAAIAALMQARMPIVYLTKYGSYLGNLNPIYSKNSPLRLAQYAAYTDPQQRLTLARGFVVGKLRNMRTVLMRYNRANPDPAISTQADSLKRCLESAQKAELTSPEAIATFTSEENEFDPELEPGEVDYGRMNGLGSLLGCEGAGSAAYFGVFGRLIKCDWPHGFAKRMRRPPTDPVNALLSYGYTVLAGQVTSAVAGVGFDPYVGWLHSSRYGKPALALDLLEEFRPIIVDSVVLSLLNNRQLNQSDFKPELNSYRMSERARRLFLQRFEERMQEVIEHPFFEYKATYRSCIELQVRLLGKYLTGEVSAYIPFIVR